MRQRVWIGGWDLGGGPEARCLDPNRWRAWRAWRALGAPLLEPVALAFEGDDVGVVNEPVDEGGGDHRVAEDLAPGLEAAVAGDDDRAALVAAGNQREEQVRCLPFQGQVADLVDDDQAVALQPFELVIEGVAVLGGLEVRTTVWSGPTTTG